MSEPDQKINETIESKEENVISQEKQENKVDIKEDQKETVKDNEETKLEEEKEKSESSKDSESESEESKESKESKDSKDNEEKKSEENEEDDDDDDDDLDVDDDNNSEESSDRERQKDPYHGYLNSKTEYKNFFSYVYNNHYLYGIKQNKFYKIMEKKNLTNNDKKALIYQFELKELKTENKNHITNTKLLNNIEYMASIYGKPEEKENINQENIPEEKKLESEEQTKENKKEEKTNEEKDKEIKENKEKDKDKGKEKEKEKEKENPYKKKQKPKNSNLKVVIKDLTEYTLFQKIRVVYLNSLNNPIVFFLKININTTIKELIRQFSSLFHYYLESLYNNKGIPLHIFINGKKHSIANKTSNKYFIPTKFDYKNDYILILEKQITKLKEFDLSTSTNTVNLKGIEIPHFVYNSLYNFEIDSFIMSKELDSLDCQIYELKKEINIRQFTDNEYSKKQKIREFLDSNWKDKTTFITSFKSLKARKSKDNWRANLFEINRKFILLQGKMYIFLIKSSNKRVHVFYGNDITTDGILIVSRNDKSIINGFRGKIISDFVAHA